MRVFVTKAFGRFARSEGITDAGLREAIDRASRGLIDADLGGGLIKQRDARPRQGRSGFAKSERDNIGTDDLARLKKLAGHFLDASFKDLEMWCQRGELKEVH